MEQTLENVKQISVCSYFIYSRGSWFFLAEMSDMHFENEGTEEFLGLN